MRIDATTTLAALLAATVLPASGGCTLIKNFDGLGGATVEAGSSSSTTAAGGAGGAEGGAGGMPDIGGAGGDGGTGAVLNCTPPPNQVFKGLVLNEIHPQGTPSDWIELVNTAAGAIDLCGVIIVENHMGGPALNPQLEHYIFDESILVSPGSHHVVALGTVISISGNSPQKYTLFTPEQNVLDSTQWYIDGSEIFEPTDTWGRIPDACGDFIKIVDNPTANGTNADPNGEGGAPTCTASGDGGDG